MNRFKMLLVPLQILVLGLAIGCSDSDDDPEDNLPDNQDFVLAEEVELNSGLVSGVEVEGSTVMAFKGIPFAAPPVGDLRWKVPQPVESWTGVKACTEFGSSAVQNAQEPFMMWSTEFIISNKTYSEDCLSLNVWTDGNSTDGKRPVIMYIHGGANTSGGSSCEVYWGDEIARKGVVYVSVNYRVGIFGFFVHPDLSAESADGVSGNYAILDQIAALKWIKNNIAQFGGDPSNVTIMGQSAGGSNVNMLCISPLAKGLFHRAVPESGNAITTTMSTLADKETIGLAVASSFDEDYSTGSSLADLRAIPAQDLLTYSNAYGGGGMFGGYSSSVTLDNHVFTNSPIDAYKAGTQNDVEMMTGAVTGDASMFGPPAAVTLAEFQANAVTAYGDLSDEFLAAYPAATDDEANDLNANVVPIDRMNMQLYCLAKARSLKGTGSTYLYHFTREMPAAGDVAAAGAFHTADVPYFLNYFYDDPETRPWEQVDYDLGDKMSSYLANFARSGNPNGTGLAQWNAFTDGTYDFMELGDEVQPLPSLTDAQFDFWKAYLGPQLGLWQ